MANVSTDPELIKQFWTELYAQEEKGLIEIRGINGGIVAQRFFSLTSPEWKDDALRVCGQLSEIGYDVFFGVNPRVRRSGEDADVKRGVALWIDYDADGDQAKIQAVYDKVTRAPVPPDWCVSSGGGLHVYWMLTQPVLLDDDDNRDAFSLALRGLSRLYDGDPKVCNESRVLRVPGFWSRKRNCKTGLIEVKYGHV